MRGFLRASVLGLILTCSPAQSQDISPTMGNGFHAKCISGKPSGFMEGYCLGLVVGIETRQPPSSSKTPEEYFKGRGKSYCYPDGVTNGQTYAVLVDYITRNPRYRHLELKDLVTLAMHEAYPCAEGGTPMVAAPGFVYILPPPAKP